MARARSADLVVATGAELEIGWLPVLIQESGNSRIQPGAPGYFEAASALQLAGGAVEARSLHGRHPSAGQSARAARSAQHRGGRACADGAARAARARAGGVLRRARQGLRYALGRGHQALGDEGRAAQGRAAWSSCIATRPIYATGWVSIEVASIEPKPGVPPTAAYLGQLVGKLTATPPKLILLNAYNDAKAARLAVGARARARGGAAVLGRRHRPRPRICSDCSTTPSTNCWRRNERHAHRFQHPVAGADRRRAGRDFARAARTAGAVARHRVHRSRHRAGGRSRRDRRQPFRAAHRRVGRAGRGRRRRAGRRAAAHLDRAQAAGGAGGADRHPVRARVHRADPVVGQRSARRREPQGPAGRADSVGVDRAADPHRGAHRRVRAGLVQMARAHRPHRLLRVVCASS